MSENRLKDKRNSRVYLKRIDFEDALAIKNWSNFSSAYMTGYNYGGLSDTEIKIWYKTINAPRKRYFSIKRKEDDLFIGFLGLKNYNPLTKKSQLGIVFDPSFVSQGYGYEAMQILLDYYFDQLEFKELVLDVNDFNHRAYKLYKKLGFVEYGKKIQTFENQLIEFDEKFFEIHNGIVYSKITKMKIRRDDR